jgi:OOP family OmpA-OmpF porin
MKLAKASGTLSLIALAALTALGSPLALAQQDHGWYVGTNVGQTRATIDDERITDALRAGGFASSTIVDDERSVGFKVFGGYQMNKYFALEGGYFNLGKFGYTATTVPAGTLRGDIKVQGLNLDLVGTLPITEKFSAFGRAGVQYAEAKDRFVGTGAVRVTNPNPSKRDTNYKIGLGLQYAFTDALAVRGEVERYRINDAVGNKGDIDMFSVGLVYRFGGKTPAPRAAAPAYVAPAPVYIAAAPAPAPVVVPPAPKRVSFSADSLFDFDKSNVRRVGAQDLDKFASDLKGTDYDLITVTGHTDRLGSDAYNQRLSTERANAVKSYLVNSAGIASHKIGAKGAGESDPVTKTGECKGNKATGQLIACLQPDRRVDVEVSGTR